MPDLLLSLKASGLNRNAFYYVNYTNRIAPPVHGGAIPSSSCVHLPVQSRAERLDAVDQGVPAGGQEQNAQGDCNR